MSTTLLTKDVSCWRRHAMASFSLVMSYFVTRHVRVVFQPPSAVSAVYNAGVFVKNSGGGSTTQIVYADE